MKPTYEELERYLEESQREFRAADATIHNMELKLTDMAVQLANSESKCRELAAENVGIKEAIPQLKNIDYQNENMDDVTWAEEIGFNAAVMAMHGLVPKTPATDSFLAEVRAQGVEMFAASLKVVGGHEHPYSAVANEFATKLRQETDQ